MGFRTLLTTKYKFRIVSQPAELQVAIIFHSNLIHLLTQLFFFLDELDEMVTPFKYCGAQVDIIECFVLSES